MDNIVDRAEIFAVRMKYMHNVFGGGKISQDLTLNFDWLERFLGARETNGIGKTSVNED
jgi:hypothetical protein